MAPITNLAYTDGIYGSVNKHATMSLLCPRRILYGHPTVRKRSAGPGTAITSTQSASLRSASHSYANSSADESPFIPLIARWQGASFPRELGATSPPNMRIAH